MKPGLVLPEVAANDAILADRVDEHVRALATHINGGLTAENLAPTTKLSYTQFTEDCSVYVLSFNVASPSVSTQYTIGTSLPGYSSRLIGLGVVKQGYNKTNPTTSSPLVNFRIGSGNSLIYSSPQVSPFGAMVGKTANVPTASTGALYSYDFTTATAYFPAEGNIFIPSASPVVITIPPDTTFYYTGVYVVLAGTHAS